MADRGMTFSALMVRAILRELREPGTGKTQTRRALKPAKYGFDNNLRLPDGENKGDVRLPGIRTGDRIYVREHWRSPDRLHHLAPREMDPGTPVFYIADAERAQLGGRHRQAMHMPRWASRITLLVTEVRVERLQDCSEADALAEGIDRIQFPEKGDWGWPQRAYAKLWDQINGLGAWDSNPWVAAYTFRPVLGNVDQIGGEA